MCDLCFDDDCRNGELCNLEPFLQIPTIQAAIRRVRKSIPDFEPYIYGSQQYTLYPRGGRRPAWLTPVWASFLRPRSFICPFCKKWFPHGGQVDHKVPWRTYIQKKLNLRPDAEVTIPLFVARALASDPINLRLICAKCNASKGTKSTAAFKAWLRRQNSGSALPLQSTPGQPRPFVSRQFREDALQERLDRQLRIAAQQKERLERVERREQSRLSRFSLNDSD